MHFKWLLLLYIGFCCATPLTQSNEAYTATFSDTDIASGEPLTIRIHTQQKNIYKLQLVCREQEIPSLALEPGYWQATQTFTAPGTYTVSINIWLQASAEPLATQQTITVSKTLPLRKIQYSTQPSLVHAGERIGIQVLLPKPVTRVTLIMHDEAIPLLETGVGLWEGGFTATTGSAGIFINDGQDTIYKPITLTLAETAANNAPTDNLSIKGNKTIAYVSRTKQGDLETYAEETRREESLNLLINGRQNNVSINASVFSTTEENVDKKDDMRIRFYTRDWEAYLGDYTETLSQNSLTLKDKALRGMRVTYTPTNDAYMVFTAKASGEDQTEYFYGNDSQGPFYCSGIPLLPGSEQLIVDNVLLVRDRDYTIDYRSGKILFKNLLRKGQTGTIRYEANIATNTGISGLQYQHNYETFAIGTTYLQAKNAAEDTTASANPLFTKKILALNTTVTLNQTIIHADHAFSEYQPDKNSPVNKSAASAGTIAYANNTLAARIQGTKTDADFEPIGNKTLAPGLSRTSGNAEYCPSTGNIFRTEQLTEQYAQYNFNNTYSYYKIFHAEDLFPEVHVIAKNTLQDTTASENIRKSLQYAHAELIKALHPQLRGGITGTKENEEDTLSNTGRYRTLHGAGGFLQTQDLAGLDAIIGTEQSKQDYFDTPLSVSRNTDHIENYAKIHLYPNQQYRLGLETRIIKDTLEGPSEITDTDFTLNPDPTIRANGQYTVQSLYEQYASDNYRVQKQKGTLLTRWQPLSVFRATLKYAPNTSIIHASSTIVAAASELKNALIDISPWIWLSGKYSYTEQTAFSKDLTQINEDILQSENKGFHHIYIVKLLPADKIDFELKHRTATLIDNQRDLSTTTAAYIKGRGQEYEDGITAYMRPWRELTVETGYSKEYRDMLHDGSPSLDYKLLTETYHADTKYRFLYFWTAHLFGSFVSVTDKLKPTDNVTHEYTPGVGLAYKIAEFSISYDYSRTESTRGTDVLSHSYVFNAQYDYSQYIHGSIARTQIVSERPHYITTEVIAKCSATF